MTQNDNEKIKAAFEHRAELMRVLEKIKRLQSVDAIHQTAQQALDRVWADLGNTS